MTYNRMEAKPIAGEHCRFCGDASAPLVRTPCCQQWICCDTAFLSFRAYSGDSCHPIQCKAATQSGGSLPPSPREGCHLRQALPAIIGAPRRRVGHAYSTGTLLVNLISSLARDSPVSWAAW